jgi:hypothetical protein
MGMGLNNVIYQESTDRHDRVNNTEQQLPIQVVTCVSPQDIRG